MTPATVTERRTEQRTDKTAIRPFHFEVPEAELIELRGRINGDKVAREGDGHGRIAGRATRHNSGSRALLGDRVRLAQVRSQA